MNSIKKRKEKEKELTLMLFAFVGGERPQYFVFWIFVECCLDLLLVSSQLYSIAFVREMDDDSINVSSFFLDNL